MHDQGAEDRREQNAAEETAVQIADDFLQHKRDRCQRCVERRRQARARARCRSQTTGLFGFAQAGGEVGRHSASELHARSFRGPDCIRRRY